MLLRLPWPSTGVTDVMMKDQHGDIGMDHGVIGFRKLEESNFSVVTAMEHQQQCCMMVGFKPCATQPLSLMADCTQTHY